MSNFDVNNNGGGTNPAIAQDLFFDYGTANELPSAPEIPQSSAASPEAASYFVEVGQCRLPSYYEPSLEAGARLFSPAPYSPPVSNPAQSTHYVEIYDDLEGGLRWLDEYHQMRDAAVAARQNVPVTPAVEGDYAVLGPGVDADGKLIYYEEHFFGRPFQISILGDAYTADGAYILYEGEYEIIEETRTRTNVEIPIDVEEPVVRSRAPADPQGTAVLTPPTIQSTPAIPGWGNIYETPRNAGEAALLDGLRAAYEQSYQNTPQFLWDTYASTEAVCRAPTAAAAPAGEATAVDVPPPLPPESAPPAAQVGYEATMPAALMSVPEGPVQDWVFKTFGETVEVVGISESPTVEIPPELFSKPNAIYICQKDGIPVALRAMDGRVMAIPFPGSMPVWMSEGTPVRIPGTTYQFNLDGNVFEIKPVSVSEVFPVEASPLITESTPRPATTSEAARTSVTEGRIPILPEAPSQYMCSVEPAAFGYDPAGMDSTYRPHHGFADPSLQAVPPGMEEAGLPQAQRVSTNPPTGRGGPYYRPEGWDENARQAVARAEAQAQCSVSDEIVRLGVNFESWQAVIPEGESRLVQIGTSNNIYEVARVNGEYKVARVIHDPLDPSRLITLEFQPLDSFGLGHYEVSRVSINQGQGSEPGILIQDSRVSRTNTSSIPEYSVGQEIPVADESSSFRLEGRVYRVEGDSRLTIIQPERGARPYTVTTANPDVSIDGYQVRRTAGGIVFEAITGRAEYAGVPSAGVLTFDPTLVEGRTNTGTFEEARPEARPAERTSTRTAYTDSALGGAGLGLVYYGIIEPTVAGAEHVLPEEVATYTSAPLGITEAFGLHSWYAVGAGGMSWEASNAMFAEGLWAITTVSVPTNMGVNLMYDGIGDVLGIDTQSHWGWQTARGATSAAATGATAAYFWSALTAAGADVPVIGTLFLIAANGDQITYTVNHALDDTPYEWAGDPTRWENIVSTAEVVGEVVDNGLHNGVETLTHVPETDVPVLHEAATGLDRNLEVVRNVVTLDVAQGIAAAVSGDEWCGFWEDCFYD